MMKQFLVIVGITGLALLHAGCASYEQTEEQRSRRLLETYPPVVTMRDDVQRKWGSTKPDIVETRPVGGWSTCPNKTVQTQVQSVERRTGKHVVACDGYRGVDGLFSLCRCWFFFDAENRLVDARWQYMSD